MTSILQTENYRLSYVESEIENPVLWENHCHAAYEMITVLEGDVRLMWEGREQRLTRRTAALIPPLCYHTVTAKRGGVYRRVTTLFDGTALPAVLRPHFEGRPNGAVIFETAVAEELAQVCRAGTLLYAPLAESLMVRIFYDSLQASDAEPTGGDALLESAIAYIDAHLSERILLRDLARHTSRSESSFSHLFEAQMKISPKQYILQKRLAQAERLIRSGTPPTVAAERVGYESYGNFYRLYRKHFGRPPSAKP